MQQAKVHVNYVQMDTMQVEQEVHHVLVVQQVLQEQEQEKLHNQMDAVIVQ